MRRSQAVTLCLALQPLTGCFWPGGEDFDFTTEASVSEPSTPSLPSSQGEAASLTAETLSPETSSTIAVTEGSDATPTVASDDSTAETESTETTATSVAETSTTDVCMTDCPEFCGNGVVEGSEECDDGNREQADWCSNTCVKARIAFISKETFAGNFALGDPDIADMACQDLADAAGLTGFFRAFLAVADETPDTRFDHGFTAAYMNTTNGVIIADGWPELSTGFLKKPILTDQHGDLVAMPAAWTGLQDVETIVANCMDWTSPMAADTGALGDAESFMTHDWLLIDLFPCDTENHIYCFEDKP